MNNLGIQTPRKPGKVALKPGHSPMDWARTKARSHNMRGPPPQSQMARLGRISKTELEKHNKKDDAWTILGGRVYNITPYLDFHPGGRAQLLRAAGKDGTALFNEYHGWVNFEMLLDKCNVGVYVGDIEDR